MTCYIVRKRRIPEIKTGATLMEHDYFETSEADDVLGSLRHLLHCLTAAKANTQEWKWVVLSLFSAVQGSIVCHAAGSTQIEVLKEKQAKDTLHWLDSHKDGQGPQPEQILAGPEMLYGRLNGSRPELSPAGGTITTSEEQDRCFCTFKSLRDDFNHLTPRGWSIEIALIKDSIPPLLDLVEAIAEKGYAFRHGQPEEIRRQLTQIRAELLK